MITNTTEKINNPIIECKIPLCFRNNLKLMSISGNIPPRIQKNRDNIRILLEVMLNISLSIKNNKTEKPICVSHFIMLSP